MTPDRLAQRLEGGLIPAVPVPFRQGQIAHEAQRAYAAWMARQPIAGVAVWAHTGRGPHLAPALRAEVLASWREALPEQVIVAGARDLATAQAAQTGGADLLLAFPRREDPVGWHRELSGTLPVIAFYLYEAAGGVSYDDETLHRILALPGVVGIKVATLDSVMTYQRIAALLREHPTKLLITGEDRFLGYSLMLGARAALTGMAAGLTALQAALLQCHRAGEWDRFQRLSAACDALAMATFVPPMEGYIRRMLWVLAADGVIPDDCCDDPWGPPLADAERESVRQAVRDARAAGR